MEQDRFSGTAIGAGVGAAVGLGMLIPGIYFLVTGEDPDQFRLKLDDAEFGLRLGPGPDGGSVGLVGTF